MITLKRLKNSKAARNAAASYFAFFSIATCAFLSIPIAVSHLEREEIGLWTVVSQIVQYLLWMDLGVGGATGRKMADAIASKDHPEINRWWTATRMALIIQGVLVAFVGIIAMPQVLGLFRVPEHLIADATVLLVGSVVIAAVSFPLKGIPGLMSAQERFHWIPFIQGLAPWISLGIFSYLLSRGYGIRSYLWGTGVSMAATWIAYSFLVRTSPQRPRWDSGGLSKERFKSLFGFSINLSGIALINAVINSIPALLISRAGGVGGLAMVPPYNFTSKGPVMLSNLVQRMSFAFHPRLQRLYVDGNLAQFESKFKQVGILSVCLGLVASGIVIAGTRTLVEVLAGPEFYGGTAMTLWLALGMISIPLAGFFQTLRQISGSMGKTLLFSAIKLIVAAALAIPSYGHFGLAGLTAVFMIVPLIDAGYGYFSGAIACGFSPVQLSGSITLAGIASMVFILLAGMIPVLQPSTGLLIHIREKAVYLPGWSECVAAAIPIIAGLAFALRQLAAMKSKKVEDSTVSVS